MHSVALDKTLDKIRPSYHIIINLRSKINFIIIKMVTLYYNIHYLLLV